MHMRTSDRILERARQDIADLVGRPKRSIGGIVLIGLLVAFGLWVWPEVHRTIRIHRM